MLFPIGHHSHMQSVISVHAEAVQMIKGLHKFTLGRIISNLRSP